MIKTFVHKSFIPTSTERLQEFHKREDSFKKLTLPPLVIKILNDSRNSLTAGTIDFVLWIGPFPVRWLAKHEAGSIATSFVDRMVKGPMKTWVHEHLFLPAEGGSILEDRISYEHKSGFRGLFSRFLFDGFPLRMLFIYRHWQTKRLILKQSLSNNI